ncbi:DUF1127 domain-containing protein [Reyranella sp.]|jgi:uncharacterized protein YjiS (DUF1127 family)|uniref:DUF1127 domain-containing protein n=1 Tax=Reyranella sp. TaxID=1929291 RepID=UPI002F958235
MQTALRFYASAAGTRTSRLWPSIRSTLALWCERSRSRRHLAMLDDRRLVDIGISRAEQWLECRKRFWQG